MKALIVKAPIFPVLKLVIKYLIFDSESSNIGFSAFSVLKLVTKCLVTRM